MKKLAIIFASVAAVAILAVSGLAVQPAAGASQVTAGMDATGAQNEGPKTLTGGGGVIPTVINIMLFIVGALAVIMIIYAGIRYVSSGGNSATVASAKNTIIYAIVGLLIAIFAYAIVNYVVFAATSSH